MNHIEQRHYLIKELLKERPEYAQIEIPNEEQNQKRLLRALMNVRMPLAISDEFLRIQDEYLQEAIRLKHITRLEDLTPVSDGLYLWQGDITTLAVDGIVNAANSQMLGCFFPNHGCIDNVIHTYSGIELRLACAKIMEEQGYDEPTGKAKITPAFNLPCKHVLHTVGPIVSGKLTDHDRELLASCYRSCLELAEANGLQSLAFCCISTGEFHFPNDEAAKIAIDTVQDYRLKTSSKIQVVFNVYKDLGLHLYRRLLAYGQHGFGTNRESDF